MTDEDWSVPETEVLRTISEFLAANRPSVVATVVRVEGSAYRRPGAKMIVEEGGAGRGHITAGCLEDEVFELTADVLAAGEPRIETYDLMEDEDDVWGLGVGCNGIIDILLEPLDSSYNPAVRAFADQEPIGMITALSGDVPTGAKAYYRPGDGIDIVSPEFPAWLGPAVEDVAADLVATGKSDSLRVDTDEGTVEVFIEGIQPAPELVVFGSGHDVGPVVELAKNNDFRVTVVGFRGATDLGSRFPRADHVVTTTPATLGDAIAIDDRTYTVVMTHNFIDDRLTVDALRKTPTPYVGLMGPRERFEEMLEEFTAEGTTFTEDELRRVYTPIGLNLGGGSPYQIATSIVAEVLAVHNDREPGHLNEREGPIHDRTSIEA